MDENQENLYMKSQAPPRKSDLRYAVPSVAQDCGETTCGGTQHLRNTWTQFILCKIDLKSNNIVYDKMMRIQVV